MPPTAPAATAPVQQHSNKLEIPQLHPTPIADNPSVQDNPSVLTNYENLAPPVMNPKPGCFWMPDSPVRTNADTNFSITSPEDLILLPKEKTGKKSYKRGKTVVFLPPHLTRLN